MTPAERPDLAALTTFRVGGPAESLTEAATEAELIEFARAHPLSSPGPRSEEPDSLFVAGGSNLLIGDEGFPGPACLIRTRGLAWRTDEADPGCVLVTAQAGHVWDDLVAESVERGLSGLEALSGIPGSVGASPVQNVGAYGAEVADTLVSLRAFDRLTGREREFLPAELGFGYRTSLLKRSAAELGLVRYVVLSVTFALRGGAGAAASVRYGQLAAALGAELGDRVPVAQVREAVIALRASKGMVLDPADHDTWSAGSFFTNPILPLPADGSGVRPAPESVLPEGAPAYPVRDPHTGEADPGLVKTSAAWLIEHAGFGRGFALDGGRAGLSTKHTLALTNRGTARAADIVRLAAHIRDGVERTFGIRMEPEPNLVGLTL
ncbi:UDP-N-acetylmuramate dehydrogenase [Brevibacterium album]|uniref:UDP-N-acetylmuramate dehydrogenase n=1 Tax=Brevibacterium album TaxID=417948 RepID=UPI0004095A16|nr:UDP-N-acetylmuramate dehydrogenase [Brevibacterium album]